jgi:transposase-like protein
MSSLADIPSEIKCKQILYEIANAGLVSCVCGQDIAWRTNNDYGWCKVCRRKIRPKAGTWLAGSNLSVQQLLKLLHCFIWRQSPSSVINATNLSYSTIERWYKRFREHLPPDKLDDSGQPIKLSGIVEVDESYFGKRRYGHQTIVVGAIERFPDPITELRRLKLKIITDTEQETLEKFIQNTIEPGSLVVTDCHAGYNDLEFLGWPHETWNHSKGHYAGTNHIEQNWSVMKRYMRKLYGNIPTKDLQLILNEWQARHNQPELFESPEKFLQGTIQG